MAERWERQLELLREELEERGVDTKRVMERLKAQQIETPSWGYSDSGTRFGVFAQAGAAITIEEKLADAAQVHKFTGVAPSVAMHVLWDLSEDMDAVKRHAESLGVRIGSINPNVFQDREYWFGSLGNSDPASREKAVQHMLDSIEIGKTLGSNVLSLWFADGTDYPGQGDFRRRKRWFQEGLKRVYDAMPESMTMLVEYKPFEPAFYHTDIADWGMAYCFAQHCGERAKVLVDLGHHLHGANIEHIVAFLLDEGRMGGFHFNNRKYADDDLTVSSVNPYELFLIYNEIAKAEDDAALESHIEFMVDQSHNTKKKIPAMIQTVEAIQAAYAKALIVPQEKVRVAQETYDTVGAESLLQQAFNTDVAPLLKGVRVEMGLDPEPLRAYLASCYQTTIERERGIRKGAGGLGQ
jgi:L-rhamnose isomerase / sugar isomerase